LRCMALVIPILLYDDCMTSMIILDPPKITDDFVDQLESVIVQILDELAPIRTGNRPHGRKGARWLSEEAISAKRLRRRLERRWKSTGAEADRMAGLPVVRPTH